MTTARTVQILDANNNNISPATSIESLYFEMTSKNTRYRMSLRSRFMVADSTIDWDDYKKVNPTDYMVPFTYVRAVEGTDNTLWQLTAGKYDVSTIISNYIHNYTNVEYVHAGERADFFYRNGSTGDNTISTNIELTGGGNTYLTIGLSNGKSGLSWNDHNAWLLKDNAGNVNLGTSGTLKINGTTLDASAFDYVTIGNLTNSQVEVCGKNINITDKKDATITVGNGTVAIDTSTKVTISSDIISLSATSQVSILDNTSLYIYGKRFPNYVLPSEDTLKYLTVEDDGTLAWNDVEKIFVKPAGSEEPTVNTFYIKNLQFTDNSSVSLVMDPNNRQDNVRLRTLVDSSSAATSYSLLATEDQKSIYFATVNDKSIISNTQHNYTFVEEENEIWQNIKRSAAENGVVKTEVNAGKFVTAVTFNNGVLGYEQCNGVEFSGNNGGQLICRQYVMTSSDRRRKTDIRPIEYKGELPEIVQFRYKDSSSLSYGVIAQDVERVGLEHLVQTDSLSTMKSVSYTELLILYIKDLQERNRLLEERVEKLEQR